MNTPWEHYQHDLISGSILPDPAQEQAMHALEKLHQQLLRESAQRRAFIKSLRKSKIIEGIYFWGNVGTGKSYLVNTFFASLPFVQKKRLHFHEFMYQVHSELKKLQGQPDPLKKLAKLWAKDTYILCLDEFLVKDIADAMILANLLQALFKAGVCLVTTANLPPKDLYQNGLQRERFLPAIKLLEQHLIVLEVNNNIDYRRVDKNVGATCRSPFVHEDISTEMATNSSPLRINDRALHCLAYNDTTVWFNFAELCATRTGTEDYLVLAKQFETIILIDIPVLTVQPTDVVLRFINLVDVLYDAHRQLILSYMPSVESEAASDGQLNCQPDASFSRVAGEYEKVPQRQDPLTRLYTGEKLAFEFKRTASRLIEMRSQQYRETRA